MTISIKDMKLPKIYYMGKEVQPRKTNGQFKKRRWFKYALIVLFAVTGIAYTGDRWVTKELVATVATPAFAEITMEAKVEALKDDIVARLEKCESGGKKEEDGIAILDSNDVGSYGPLQFQRKTVMHYYELKEGKPINGRDAIILALQGDKARDLARWVIFETPNGVAKDWTNCSRQLGLQKEVDVVNKLTK